MSLQRLKEYLKQYSFVRRFIKGPIWQGARYWYGCVRHRITLWIGDRLTHETYTRFMRVPGQFDALVESVIDHLAPKIGGRQLRIVVLGCSNGSEPYTIASNLHQAHPELDFHIVGVDLSAEALRQARAAVYHRDEIYNHELVTEEFVARTFDRDPSDPDLYHIKPELRRRAEFHERDILDPELPALTGRADIVFVQNTLFNVTPSLAERMFAVAVSLLNEHGALFVDGADLHQRARLSLRYNLRPLTHRIKEIHHDVMHIRAKGWPNIYWGIEPYWEFRRDHQRRYATIFLTGDGR